MEYIEFNGYDVSMLEADTTLCCQNNEALLAEKETIDLTGNNQPRQSLLAIFDPLYGEPNLDLSDEKPVEEAEHFEDIDRLSDIHSFAETLVNSLIECAVHKVEDKLFIENNITHKLQDDMAAINNKLEDYEDETLRLKLLLKQKEADEIVLLEKLQKLELELETKSNTLTQFKNKIEEADFGKIIMQYERLATEHSAKFNKLDEEHNTAKLHLANLELAFADLLKKYERSKEIINGYKCNEDTLREQLQTSEETRNSNEQKYESLKTHARSQLERAHQELQIIRDQRESDIIKLHAIIKRLEIKNNSLADSLDQKSKECAAIAALCDEVTGKV